MRQKYGDKNLMIVGVSVDEDRPVVEKFLTHHPPPYPIVLTTENEIPRPYQMGVFPTYIVIDSDGNFASHRRRCRLCGTPQIAQESRPRTGIASANHGTKFNPQPYHSLRPPMLTFILLCLLFVFCWPLALIAICLYPIVWLLLLPFRLVGIAVHGALSLVEAIIFLPVRVLRSIT
jgi:hypothetical protein